jgi:hypothetical protein
MASPLAEAQRATRDKLSASRLSQPGIKKNPQTAKPSDFRSIHRASGVIVFGSTRAQDEFLDSAGSASEDIGGSLPAQLATPL